MNHYDYAFPPSILETSDGRIITGDSVSHGGIDMRTYIATAALQGLLANNESGRGGCRIVASAAVQYADALITELNKPEEVQQ